MGKEDWEEDEEENVEEDEEKGQGDREAKEEGGSREGDRMYSVYHTIGLTKCPLLILFLPLPSSQLSHQSEQFNRHKEL